MKKIDQCNCQFEQCQVSQFIDIIKVTFDKRKDVSSVMDNILRDIKDHIDRLNPKILDKRHELLIAIRLVECFKIFNWIRVCLVCGSYQSIFRELRFILEAVALACYIDLNHRAASLESKIEVFKALSDVRGFYGSDLFDKIKGLSQKNDIKKLYRDLSNFVHPSTSEDHPFIDPGKTDAIVDSLKWNKFDDGLLEKTIVECKNVARTVININDHFVKSFLQSRS